MPAAWKNSAMSGDSGGAAGDEEAQPAAEAGAQLGEDQLVGDARAWRLQHGAGLLAGQLQRG